MLFSHRSWVVLGSGYSIKEIEICLGDDVRDPIFPSVRGTIGKYFGDALCPLQTIPKSMRCEVTNDLTLKPLRDRSTINVKFSSLMTQGNTRLYICETTTSIRKGWRL